jgi:signal transduction histidine kinase
MAKAVFHKGQRVYVKPVATWAVIEAVNPQWVKGVEEPLRVTYDAGLGRDFQAHELAAEEQEPNKPDLIETENWRVLRAVNRLSADACHPRYPYPGTFPVVVTDEKDWGGWRVPMAEYDREPSRIEHQARIMANAIRLMRVARELIEFTQDNPHETPTQLRELAMQAEMVMAAIYHDPTPKAAEAVAAAE